MEKINTKEVICLAVGKTYGYKVYVLYSRRSTFDRTTISKKGIQVSVKNSIEDKEELVPIGKRPIGTFLDVNTIKPPAKPVVLI